MVFTGVLQSSYFQTILKNETFPTFQGKLFFITYLKAGIWKGQGENRADLRLCSIVFSFESDHL